MWLFVSTGFVSIVEDKEHAGNLLVRSRIPEHISALFPDVKINKTPKHDYLYRVSLPREIVAKVVADRVTGINYGNFKDSIICKKLHSIATSIWHTVYSIQELPKIRRRKNKQTVARLEEWWKQEEDSFLYNQIYHK